MNLPRRLPARLLYAQRYGGALDMGGLPAIEAQYCQTGVDAAGTMAIVGFTVTP